METKERGKGIYGQARKTKGCYSYNCNQPLQLQAYERMMLLVDRIALPNLIGRTTATGLSARDMQVLLTQQIRQEFEYNVTHQIYVTAESWEAEFVT